MESGARSSRFERGKEKREREREEKKGGKEEEKKRNEMKKKKKKKDCLHFSGGLLRVTFAVAPARCLRLGALRAVAPPSPDFLDRASKATTADKQKVRRLQPMAHKCKAMLRGSQRPRAPSETHKNIRCLIRSNLVGYLAVPGSYFAHRTPRSC